MGRTILSETSESSGHFRDTQEVFTSLDTQRGPWHTTAGTASVTLVGSQGKNMGSHVH